VKEDTRELLAPLLSVLRGYSRLEEVAECEFFLHGRDFIHFHETDDGVIADVLLAKGRVSMAVSTSQQQADLLGRIESQLESLERHGHRRGGNRGRDGRRDS